LTATKRRQNLQCGLAIPCECQHYSADSSGRDARTTTPLVCGRHSDFMARQEDRDIREELTKLRTEHRALDQEIALIELAAHSNQLLVKRLKRKKLQLKDQISDLEDKLLPDIIA
jgi:hypothetical protein